MENDTMETATQTTEVATPATSPHESPAHQGMVDYLAEVMHHNQQAGRSAYDTIRVINRQAAQIAATPDEKLLKQHEAYAETLSADVTETHAALIACAEPQKGRDFHVELHCDALDKLNLLEQQDVREADREYHVIRAAAVAYCAAEHYLASNQYLTHAGIDSILATQQLNDHEMSAARALFMLFQREKIPHKDLADKEQYHARAMKMPEHLAHAAGD